MRGESKVKVRKRGRVWEFDCPHCFKPFGAIHIFSSFTSAIVEAHKHLRARHATAPTDVLEDSYVHVLKRVRVPNEQPYNLYYPR